MLSPFTILGDFSRWPWINFATAILVSLSIICPGGAFIFLCQRWKTACENQYPNLERCFSNVAGRCPRVWLKRWSRIRDRARRRSNRAEGQRLHSLLRFEIELWLEGVTLVAGVDEAGMAPLAGPVVAGAVILPQNYKLRGLNDSKKILDQERREELAAQIKQDAICWSVGFAAVEEIDKINIYHAGLLAMQRALHGLSCAPQFVLVDARRIPNCAVPQRGIIHGDALSASIAAASIIAKTTRDAYMIELDAVYSGYGLATHKGFIDAALPEFGKPWAWIQFSRSSSKLNLRSSVRRQAPLETFVKVIP